MSAELSFKRTRRYWEREEIFCVRATLSAANVWNGVDWDYIQDKTIDELVQYKVGLLKQVKSSFTGFISWTLKSAAHNFKSEIVCTLKCARSSCSPQVSTIFFSLALHNMVSSFNYVLSFPLLIPQGTHRSSFLEAEAVATNGPL